MKHIFAKHSARGFTLIELLVVIAIIGLLSAVIAAPINNARKKAKDGQKVANVKALQGALGQYADELGYYPSTLAELVPKYIQSVPVDVAGTATAANKYMYVVYRDSGNRNIGYHLGVKLEQPNLALDGDSDCIGTTGAAAAGNCNYAASGSVAINNILFTNWNSAATTASHAATQPAAATADFDGGSTAGTADNSSTACLTATVVNSSAACVFDVVGF